MALALRGWNLLLFEWTCPLRQLTGVPCPTCFLTRSLLAACRGDASASLHWHPLGLPLLAVMAVITALLLGAQLPAPRRLWPLGAGTAGAVVLVWLIRLWGWQHGAPLPG
jgi:hypothetical protein